MSRVMSRLMEISKDICDIQDVMLERYGQVAEAIYETRRVWLAFRAKAPAHVQYS